MKARTRSVAIFMTFLFIGLVGYTGFLLYELPNKIVTSLEKNRLEKIETIRKRLSANKDSRRKISDKEILRNINEIASQPDTRESDKRQEARKIAEPLYYFFGGMLLVGIILMFILLANSYKASADTIVYIDKDDDDNRKDNKEKHAETKLDGLLSSIQEEDIQEDINPLEAVLFKVCKKLEAGTGAIYQAEKSKEVRKIILKTSYAFVLPDSGELSYEFGEGLSGQVAKTAIGKIFHPVPDGYIQVFSGLGDASPNYLAIMPIMKEKEVLGVLEIALFEEISEADYRSLEEIVAYIGEQLM